MVNRVNRRAKELGVDDTLDAAKDVTEKAIPIVAKSASSEKRRMIEDVILNSIVHAEQVGVEAAAGRALRIIDELSDEAAVVFAIMAAAPQGALPAGNTHTFDQLPDVGLPWFMENEALEELSGAGLVQIDEWHPEEDGSQKPPTVIDEWSFTPKGTWLRTWIIVNSAQTGS